MAAESLEAEIRALEERLLKPAVRASAEELEQLLADDFLEFGSSGRIFDRDEVIRYLLNEPPLKIAAVEEFSIIELSPDVVLATYQVQVRSGQPESTSTSLRSSLWARREGRWQLVFHQGTPKPAP